MSAASKTAAGESVQGFRGSILHYTRVSQPGSQELPEGSRPPPPPAADTAADGSKAGSTTTTMPSPGAGARGEGQGGLRQRPRPPPQVVDGVLLGTIESEQRQNTRICMTGSRDTQQTLTTGSFMM